jgi:hypothetical protein
MALMKSLLEQGLKDMKVSRLQDDKVEAPVSDIEYPYGLKIRLSRKELENLDLDVTKINVGESSEMKIRALVTSISKDDSGPSESRELCLQITHMCLCGDDAK